MRSLLLLLLLCRMHRLLIPSPRVSLLHCGRLLVSIWPGLVHGVTGWRLMLLLWMRWWRRPSSWLWLMLLLMLLLTAGMHSGRRVTAHVLRSMERRWRWQNAHVRVRQRGQENEIAVQGRCVHLHLLTLATTLVVCDHLNQMIVLVQHLLSTMSVVGNNGTC